MASNNARRVLSTVALLGALGGLVAYIYLVDAKRPESSAEIKPKAFAVSQENIEEVVIRTASGETGRVQKTDATWHLVEPEKVEADTAAIDMIANNIATLEVQRVVDENPADLSQYGLDPPRVDVSFRVKDQKEFQRLLVGEKTAIGNGLYAKKPDEKRVVLIYPYLDSIFNKTPFELRDRKVLKIDREKAEGVEIVRGSTTLQLAKSGTDWRIVKPIAGRAEYNSAESVVADLSLALMQKVVASDGGNLRTYGLDTPRITATVTSGSSRATVQIGRAGEGGVLAKDASRPLIFTVEQTLVTALEKDLSAFRRKDLFDARPFTANRVELRRGDNVVVLEKTEADGKATWRNAAGQSVDTARVEDVVTKLSALQAQSFEPGSHASLKKPVLTAALTFDKTKTETVTFGTTGIEIFAGRPDEPGTAKINGSIFDEAIRAIDALK